MRTGFGGPTFTARYTSECANCGEDIEPGDPARYNQDDEAEHAGCPSGPRVIASPVRVCTSCWTEHAGECL